MRVLLRKAWAMLVLQYYTAALRHLSQFDPMHPDLVEVMLGQARAKAVVEGWE